jgi:hypothetical protein
MTSNKGDYGNGVGGSLYIHVYIDTVYTYIYIYT